MEIGGLAIHINKMLHRGSLKQSNPEQMGQEWTHHSSFNSELELQLDLRHRIRILLELKLSLFWPYLNGSRHKPTKAITYPSLPFVV